MAQAPADQRDALLICRDQFDARQNVCDRLGGAPYDPEIDPTDFVPSIDNRFLPLTPGTTLIYEGQTAMGFEHEEFVVTHKTKMILGIPCIEVNDTSTVDGKLVEDTLDWFAQDEDGNVWYMGENARQFADGEVIGVEGSWTAGVNGAKPGIAMKAHPMTGDFYRQEFSLGEAEDIGEVRALGQSVMAGGHTYDDCLKTQDTSPLDLGGLEHKFYAPYVGLVSTVDPSSGEKLDLVQVLP